MRSRCETRARRLSGAVYLHNNSPNAHSDRRRIETQCASLSDAAGSRTDRTQTSEVTSPRTGFDTADRWQNVSREPGMWKRGLTLNRRSRQSSVIATPRAACVPCECTKSIRPAYRNRRARNQPGHPRLAPRAPYPRRTITPLASASAGSPPAAPGASRPDSGCDTDYCCP